MIIKINNPYPLVRLGRDTRRVEAWWQESAGCSLVPLVRDPAGIGHALVSAAVVDPLWMLTEMTIDKGFPLVVVHLGVQTLSCGREVSARCEHEIVKFGIDSLERAIPWIKKSTGEQYSAATVFGDENWSMEYSGKKSD